MANRYVDFVNGADANNGQGPDASHATNKPWKTLTKALGATGIASGDTVYLSPAGPFRETVAVAMTSAVAETFVVGDYANAQGFKTSGAVAVAPGPVIVTAFTTNDKTAASATTLLNLSARDFLTFQNIMFVGGSAAAMVTATTTTSTNIKFTDCAFLSSNNKICMNVSTVFGTALNWTIDRCLFLGEGANFGIAFTLPGGTGADYDANVLIQNSFIIWSAPFQVGGSAGANKGGGIRIRNCFAITSGSLFTVSGALLSTTIPCVIDNCFGFQLASNAFLTSGAAGQLTEAYNLLVTTNPRTNVTAGTGSISDLSYAPLFHFGQERIWGGLQRPFGEPMAGSPMLGFGNDGSQTVYDLRNKPRPAGGVTVATPAAGAMERGNTWLTDPSPIGGGGSAIKSTGPAYAEFLIPVPARAITISVKVKWDGTYAGTKPQFQIDANPRIGVTAETKTATVAATNIETLTLSAFTPSKAGDMVTVRVISNDTNGAGLVQADDFLVTG